MRLRARILAGMLAVIVPSCAAAAASADHDAPQALKVDPPSWWSGHSLNPVRLMIQGRNLAGARVESSVRDLRPGAARVNAAGTCLFVDMDIEPGSAGRRTLEIATAHGRAAAAFEILKPLPRRGRFQGFSSDDVIYLVMPDRFAQGKSSQGRSSPSPEVDRTKGRYFHGGNLQGIIDHLPYIKALGATALWITPLYANYDGLYPIPTWSSEHYADYHGYGPVNYYAVDRHFGDMAKLRELVDKAHGLGLKIILDQVSNHTGPYHPWVKDPPTQTWYHGTPQKHLQNPFQTWLLADPYASADILRPVMEGWFGDMLPDLNQDDPELARYLIQNMLWWLGMSGADGLRHDLFAFIPRIFWKNCLAALKREYPNLRDMGEVNGDDPATVSYYQGGRAGFDGIDTGLDSVFDFPLRKAMRAVFLEGKPISELAAILSADRLYPNPMMLVDTLGLHDDPRFMGGPQATTESLKLAFAFLLTTRGIPLIYYGDEIAMSGGEDPDNRRDFPGGWRGDPRDAFARSGRTKQEEDVFEYVRRLTRLRAASDALRRGRLVNLAVGEHAYVYARITGSDWAIVALNSGSRPEKIEFEIGPLRLSAGANELEDHLGGAAKAQVAGERMRIDIPARSSAVYTASIGGSKK